MKTVSNDLFDLIQSLTKQEKRYFKLYASRHVIGEQNKYVLLFDAIGKQKSYDEPKIKIKFKGQTFIKQLHVTKNYLYNLILRSLRDYTSSESDKAYELLRNAKILYKKGLRTQSEKVLARAKKLVKEEENFLQLLEILKWEQIIIHDNNDFNKLAQQLSAEQTEELAVLKRYENLLLFNQLRDRIMLKYSQIGFARTQAERQQLKAIVDQPLYRDASNTDSTAAKISYFNAFFIYYFCIGDIPKGYETAKKLVHCIEEVSTSKHLSKKYSSRYMDALVNLCISQKYMKTFDEAYRTLEKLRHLPAKSNVAQAGIFSRSYQLELDIYCFAGEFEKGVECVEKIKAEFEQHKKVMDKQTRLAFYYNFAYTYFGAGDFQTSWEWVNVLLDDPDLSLRGDIHSFARLLNLLIQFELDNDRLLESAVKSTKRFLRKRKRLHLVESIFLQFLTKAPFRTSKKAQIPFFKELRRELTPLALDPFEKHAFEYFDWLSWLESKIEGGTFATIVRSRMSGG